MAIGVLLVKRVNVPSNSHAKICRNGSGNHEIISHSDLKVLLDNHIARCLRAHFCIRAYDGNSVETFDWPTEYAWKMFFDGAPVKVVAHYTDGSTRDVIITRGNNLTLKVVYVNIPEVQNG